MKDQRPACLKPSNLLPFFVGVATPRKCFAAFAVCVSKFAGNLYLLTEV